MAFVVGMGSVDSIVDYLGPLVDRTGRRGAALGSFAYDNLRVVSSRTVAAVAATLV